MAAERSMVRSLPSICQFGRYELLGRIAVGGMAEIYLAREPEKIAGAGDRHVVIKRVLSHVADDPAFIEMFFDEARLAMRLQHPAIVHIYEFGEEAGSYFLAMEWVDGVALGKTIRRARAKDGMPPAIAVKITATIAEALHYAHHLVDDEGLPMGIVHRDVSPQNIVISYDGSVKLLDFGIAKAQDQSRRTNDGQVKGKFAYMSPQQCLGDEIDGRADVFALGVCLYEALTGRPLYHRKTQYETQRAVVEDAVPSIRVLKPDLPVELDAIVQKALAKEPAQRFPTAGDMHVALERWLGSHQEVVPATRIATYLAELYGEEFRGGPMVDSTPFGQSFQREKPDSAPPPSIPKALQRSEPPPPLRSSVPPPPPPKQRSLPPPAPVPQLPAGPNPSVAPNPPAMAAPVATPAPIASSTDPSSEDELPTRNLGAWIIGLIVLLLVGTAGVFLWQTPTDELISQVAPGENTGVDPAAQAPTPNPALADPILAPADPELGDPGSFAAPQDALPADDLPEGPAPQDPVVAPEATAMTEDDPSPATSRMSRSMRVRPTMSEAVAQPEVAQPVAPEMTEAVMETEPAPASGNGSVSINTRPWSLVYLGDRLLGTTPIGRVSIPAGSARLRFVDRDGTEHHRSVRVNAGEDTRSFFDFRESD